MLNVVVTATGPLFTLDEAKVHLNVLHADDDTNIEVLSNAAVAAVLQHCNIATVPEGDIPEAAFKVASLIVLSVLYGGGQLDAARLPASARMLVDPYRWLRV
ncbi:phage gp6-like head-tail connector protein [Caulobacter zeae]|uniref:Phage gp6-like head-tail connector protein n=1 Tax=Caulobacter zeae TaxID=2055137 RepID=A0A2N5DQ27_9CAUL|nr:head-tail connector protein [Caulobacter zeae]PLR28144.1 phage gp6-like head-tail connector protein [Caulobacter zeae]